MAASMVRTCGFRLNNSIEIFSRVFCEPDYQRRISRHFVSQEQYSDSVKIKRKHIAEKVWTDNDFEVHNRICGLLLGKKGKALKKFIFETGIKFNVQTTDDGYILVSGKNAEVVKKAVGIITPHINKIKREVQNSICEKLFIDEDEAIRYKISGQLIGRNGQNIDRIRADIGIEFKVVTLYDGHLLVYGTDDGAVKCAKERLTLEIQEIRNGICEY